MIDSNYRSVFQAFLFDPVANIFVKYEVHPNVITLFSGLTGACFLPAMYFGQPYVALFFLAISGYLDVIDGTVARKLENSSPLGTILDIISDRFVELCVVLGLYLVSPDERATYCLLMLGSFYLSITIFLVVGIFENNESEKSFHYSPGLIERTEAFAFFGLMVLLPNYFPYIAILFTVLVYYTAADRFYQAIKKHRSPTAG